MKTLKIHLSCIYLMMGCFGVTGWADAPRVLMIGDSNTQIGYIFKGLREAIARDYGDGGAGYISCNPEGAGGAPAGFVMWVDSAWQRYDMHTNGVPLTPPHLAPDGLWVETTNTGAIALSRFKGTGSDLYWLSQPGGGSFSVSMDSVLLTNIATAGSGMICSVWRGPDLPYGAHTVTVTSISGKVTLLGVDARVEAGGVGTRAVAHKWGNATSTTRDFLDIETNVMRSVLQALSPNIVAILLGTNDSQIDSRTAVDFKANLIALTQRIQAALPGVQVVVISTFETWYSLQQGILPQYVATSFPEAAQSTGAIFWNMYSWFGPFQASRMLDDNHVNGVAGPVIGEALYAQIKSRLLGVTNGPSCHLKLDETVGTFALDAGGNGAYNLVTGATSWVSAHLGNGLAVSPAPEGYVTISNPPVLDDIQEGDYSISVRFKSLSIPAGTNTDCMAYGIVMKAGYHTGLMYYTNGLAAMIHYLSNDVPTGAWSSGVVSTGVFHHLVGVVSRSTGRIRIYVDGVCAPGGGRLRPAVPHGNLAGSPGVWGPHRLMALTIDSLRTGWRMMCGSTTGRSRVTRCMKSIRNPFQRCELATFPFPLQTFQ